MPLDYTIGQVVYSKAGRDAGKKFIIVNIPDESYVYISDGDLRRIEKPKRKKAKHLLITGEIIKPLNEKLLNEMKVTNSEVRRALEDPRQ
jgi:ribosomal protein L14E/L6E/L27E